MPSEKAIELAAQAWCQKETSGIEMDSRLAMAFACIIDRVALQETRSGGERTTNSAMVPLLAVKSELDKWPVLSEYMRERIVAKLSQQHQ